jgi:hypothetical protein
MNITFFGIAFVFTAAGCHDRDRAVLARSSRAAERQVDAAGAERLVPAVPDRSDAMEPQSRRPAPHDDVAVNERHALRAICALVAAEQEPRAPQFVMPTDMRRPPGVSR